MSTHSSADFEDFDESFYITKICTSYLTRDDYNYCNDGYLLKSETLNTGEVKETILLEEIGSYGWSHTVVNKIDADTYHVYVGCGNPCGTNMLYGRGNKEQSFGREFNFHLDSQCSVSYDSKKQLWTASRFFADDVTALPSTYSPNKYAAYPSYNVEFDKNGRLTIKEYFSEEVIQALPNPCASI